MVDKKNGGPVVDKTKQKEKGLQWKTSESLVFYGGPSADRTPDLLIKSQLLYQLS